MKNVNHPCCLLLRSVLKCALKPILFRNRRCRVVGQQNLPRTREPLVIVSNHPALIDSVYYICALRPRFMVCGAKPKYFSTSFRRIWMGIGNILKVENRDQFIHDCRRLLHQGETLLIYPEMGRTPHGLGPFKSWAVEIALESKTSILPCHISGTTDRRAKKTIRVGSSIAPHGTPESLTQYFRQAILKLGGSV